MDDSRSQDRPNMIEALAEDDVRHVWRLASSAVRRLETLPFDHPERAHLASVTAHAAAAGTELVRRDAI